MMTLFLAAQAAANANQGGGGMGMLVMMVAIFAIMWLFMIRPQQKRQKEIRKFQDALTSGSKVVTGCCIYGTVKSIDLVTNKIELEIARGVVITVDKNSVFADVNASKAQ